MLGKIFSKISDRVQEQAWFQQLKSKWEELDPSMRFYIQIGSFIGSILIVLSVTMSWTFKVKSLKSDLAAKIDIRTLIRSATDEMQRLQVPGRMDAGESANWSSTIQSVAITAGLDPSTIEVSAEKSGASTPMSKEALIDVKVQHVNIRQLIRFALQLENGNQPIKLRNLLVEAEDPEGYVNGTLAISGFELKKN